MGVESASTHASLVRRIGLAIVGYTFAAIAWAFVFVAVRTGTKPGDSWFGIIVGYALVALVFLGAAFLTWYATWQLVGREPYVVLDDAGVKEQRGRHTLRTIALGDVTRLQVVPGQRTTVGSGRGPTAPATQGASTRNTAQALISAGDGNPIIITEGPGWADVIDVLVRWVVARPDLLTDETTAAILR